MNGHILLADGPIPEDEYLGPNLELLGHRVMRSDSGMVALMKLQKAKPELLILELRVSDAAGLNMLAELRRHDPFTRVIAITSSANEGHTTLALRAGANDCVPRPYTLMQVVARVENQLRDARLICRSRLTGGVVVDGQNALARIHGEVVRMTPMEARLLKVLIDRSGQLLSKPELMDCVWNTKADLHTRTIQTHVAQIRRKLRRFGLDRHLVTVRRGGLIWKPFADA